MSSLDLTTLKPSILVGDDTGSMFQLNLPPHSHNNQGKLTLDTSSGAIDITTLASLLDGNLFNLLPKL
jgi:hypothetical protein